MPTTSMGGNVRVRFELRWAQTHFNGGLNLSSSSNLALLRGAKLELEF